MFIYKYRSLDDAAFPFSHSIVKDRTIYFSSYDQLNDPFEYSYLWTTDGDHASKVAFWSKLDEMYKNTLSGKHESKQRADIEQWERTMAAPRGNKMIGVDRAGIFCSSAGWENHVLWSLYADKHQGVVFQFESTEDDVLRNARAVSYREQPAPFNLYRGINLHEVLTTKFHEWAHEQEFRVFSEIGLRKFDQPALKSVIFGLNAFFNSDNRAKVELVIETTKKNFPGVAIKRALRSNDAYKFRLQDI
jgi:hypothetical protein